MRNLFRALIKPSDNKLFSRAMSAGFWAGALRITLRASMLVRTVILARLLIPDDFGLMAIATISILLVERLTESGIDAALVQRSDDVREYFDTAWTMQIVRAFVIAVVVVAAAPFIASFFGAPEAETIIRVLAISVVIKGFTNIAVVLFIKELQFNRHFVLEMAGRGLDLIVSITLAFVLRSVWALVFGILAGAAARLITSYIIDSYRPRLQWTWIYIKRLFNFGKWILVGNFLGFAVTNLDDIIVGRFLGVSLLGQYRMAYNFSQAVSTEITAVANQVAFPAYSKLQDSADRLRDAFMGALHFVSFLGFPIALGTALVAPDLVRGLLGEQWEPAIVPLQLLAIASLVRSVSAATSPLFNSQGRPSIPPRFGLARLVLMAISLPPAVSQLGIDGAAWVVGVTGVIVGSAALFTAFRWVDAGGSEIRQALFFPALNSGVMAALVVGANRLVASENALVSLGISVAVGIVGYFASVTVSTKLLHYHAPGDLLGRVRKAAIG